MLQAHINVNFAKFSEALYITDRHACEEVQQRALMQQKLSQKEKETKEENLQLLAQHAQEERSDASQTVSSRPTAESREPAKLRDDLCAEKRRK